MCVYPSVSFSLPFLPYLFVPLSGTQVFLGYVVFSGMVLGVLFHSHALCHMAQVTLDMFCHSDPLAVAWWPYQASSLGRVHGIILVVIFLPPGPLVNLSGPMLRLRQSTFNTLLAQSPGSLAGLNGAVLVAFSGWLPVLAHWPRTGGCPRLAIFMKC